MSKVRAAMLLRTAAVPGSVLTFLNESAVRLTQQSAQSALHAFLERCEALPEFKATRLVGQHSPPATTKTR